MGWATKTSKKSPHGLSDFSAALFQLWCGDDSTSSPFSPSCAYFFSAFFIFQLLEYFTCWKPEFITQVLLNSYPYSTGPPIIISKPFNWFIPTLTCIQLVPSIPQKAHSLASPGKESWKHIIASNLFCVFVKHFFCFSFGLKYSPLPIFSNLVLLYIPARLLISYSVTRVEAAPPSSHSYNLEGFSCNHYSGKWNKKHQVIHLRYS